MLFAFYCKPEFDKNANSLTCENNAIKALCYIGIGLATIGVCVFYAVTSVAAFFIIVAI